MVDDSCDDRFFLKELILKTTRFRIVGEVEDGERAISYLRGDNEFGDRSKWPFPDLLLLDLTMPLKTGFEVLAWMRRLGQPIPTIILSGACLPEDIARCRALGAWGFVKKTPLHQALKEMLPKIEEALEQGGSIFLLHEG